MESALHPGKAAPACAPHRETVETRRARGFFSDERGRDDRRNLRPPGREIAPILRAAALIGALATESTGPLPPGYKNPSFPAQKLKILRMTNGSHFAKCGHELDCGVLLSSCCPRNPNWGRIHCFAPRQTALSGMTWEKVKSEILNRKESEAYRRHSLGKKTERGK